MKLFSFILSLSIISVNAAASEPEGRMTSPFEACKNVVVVEKDKYMSNQKKWDEYAKECNAKIQPAIASGFTSLDPLRDGVEYMEFSQRVAKKVLENLNNSRMYAYCSQLCFRGEKICHKSLSIDKKEVDCVERKKEVVEGMKIKARKLRIELAMANENHAFVKTNVENVTRSDTSSFINIKLESFEKITPFPVSKVELASYEIKEAERRWTKERKEIVDQVKAMNSKIPAEITARKLMENFDEHKSRYRSLIYEEAPIFSVIGEAKKFVGTDPVWDDLQIANAFQKLSDNAFDTEEKVKKSINSGKLEFSRMNLEATQNWLRGFTKDGPEIDLLYYIGMKSQVEEVLKEDPSACATATSMVNRIKAKDYQNLSFTIASTLVSAGSFKVAEMGTKGVLRVATAVTGKVASGLIGVGLGTGYLGNSFSDYKNKVVETATASGLDEKSEGPSLRKDRDVEKARDALETNLALAPIDGFVGLGTGKILFDKNTRRAIADASLTQATKVKLSPAQKLNILKADRIQAETNSAQAKASEKQSRELFKNNNNQLENPPESLILSDTARYSGIDPMRIITYKQFDELPMGTILESSDGRIFIKGVDKSALLGRSTGVNRTSFGFRESRFKTRNTQTETPAETLKDIEDLKRKATDAALSKQKVSELKDQEETLEFSLAHSLFDKKAKGKSIEQYAKDSGYEHTKFPDLPSSKDEVILIQYQKDGVFYNIEGKILKKSSISIRVKDGNGLEHEFGYNVLSKFFAKPKVDISL